MGQRRSMHQNTRHQNTRRWRGALLVATTTMSLVALFGGATTVSAAEPEPYVPDGSVVPTTLPLSATTIDGQPILGAFYYLNNRSGAHLVSGGGQRVIAWYGRGELIPHLMSLGARDCPEPQLPILSAYRLPEGYLDMSQCYSMSFDVGPVCQGWPVGSCGAVERRDVGR